MWQRIIIGITADGWRSVEMEALVLAHNLKLSLTGRGSLDEVIAAWVARRERLPDPCDVIASGYALKRR